MSWTATVSCDCAGCSAHTTAEIEVNPNHVGRIRVRSVAAQDWSVPTSGCGSVRCPAHTRPATRSSAASSDAHVHRQGHCDTSNCIEARRGDSRFYTIGGQLIPPTGH
jgi:hypothetical protein